MVDRAFATACAVGAAALVGACGGGGGGGGGHTARTTAAAPKPGPAAARQQITRNWVEFFNPRTPTSTRVQLLQNGGAFRQVIATQAQSPLAQQTKATVGDVKLSAPKRAAVHYTILLGGKPALKNQTGTAVESGGVWKVSDRSFCGLLSLQGSAPSSCPKG